MADARMTLDEAEAHVLAVRAVRAEMGQTFGDQQAILAIVAAVKELRQQVEFLRTGVP